MDIQAYMRTNKCLLTEKECRYIADIISNTAPSNLLVFGVGFDSGLWLKLNQGGETVFLEHDHKWIELIKTKVPDIHICEVQYTTKRRQWQLLLFTSMIGITNRLVLNLPGEIYEKAWDIIFVDSPQGDSPLMPGRMQSIYTASILKSKHVLVHDCDRRVERKYSERFLGNKIKQTDRLIHYIWP